MNDVGQLHAHHVVERSIGVGWKYLHDPDVNGAALCPICHGNVHDHTVEDWHRWIRPLRWGEDRAEPFSFPEVREHWQLVARLRWPGRELSSSDAAELYHAIGLSHALLLTLPHDSVAKLTEIAAKYGVTITEP
ncbi:MAG: hypothetical protein GY711_11440 [bacterium]|nr:hypothetical protein [bacterium]